MSGGVRGDARKRTSEQAELVAAMNEAHDQMAAAWSYYIEAKAAFSIAAGELALHKHRNGSALAAALIEHQEKP